LIDLSLPESNISHLAPKNPHSAFHFCDGGIATIILFPNKIIVVFNTQCHKIL